MNFFPAAGKSAETGSLLTAITANYLQHQSPIDHFGANLRYWNGPGTGDRQVPADRNLNTLKGHANLYHQHAVAKDLQQVHGRVITGCLHTSGRAHLS